MGAKIIFRALLLGAALCALACSKKEKRAEQAQESADSSKWEGMDEFHEVMATCFHPFKDSANLEPARTHAASMAAAATAWQEATLPAKVNTDAIKGKLEELKRKSITFAETANSGDDAAVGDSLTTLHNIFHELQETWYK